MSRDPMGSSASGAPRLLLVDDGPLLHAAEVARLAADWRVVVPRGPAVTPSEPLSVGDVAVLVLDRLPAEPLPLASTLAELAPARVLLVVEPTADPGAVVQALRLGVHDVLVAPVRPDALRLRLALGEHHPGVPTRGATDVGRRLHELTNVLAAAKLTASVVARLSPRTAPDGAAPHDEWRELHPGAVAERIEREIDEAVGIVREIEQRLVPPSAADHDHGHDEAS